jgi:DNA-binding transcriptional ArsR family regulator
MAEGPEIARVAALIGEPARANMLTALLAGQALTASELAGVAAVTKQTASAHLSKLLGACLVAVESQGRHRYFRLADRQVARLLEQLMGAASRTVAGAFRSGPQEPALRKARVCYDHLAGELGVLAFESLEQRKFLELRGAALTVAPKGRRFFRELGIDVGALSGERRTLGRPCLDWSVRRHHLAGALGAALLSRILEVKWARRLKGSRAVSFSNLGEAALRERFPVTDRIR